MSKQEDRRKFLKHSTLAATGAAMMSFEEKALLAANAQPSPDSRASSLQTDFPQGKIKDLSISRLICGGNLLSGHAHSRDLIYVSSLLKQYFTDDKVFETFELCEENGINTMLVRVDDDTKRIIGRYWNERGGQMQWIAQVKPKINDLTSDIQRAVDRGAAAIYIQGQVSDRFVSEEHVDLLGEAVEIIRKNGIVAGIGAHELNTVVACNEAGLDPDFYMKTINSKSYWSAGPMPRKDSVWAETPEETIAYMNGIKQPWIAFKILGAGAIKPQEGFRYAFESGADFICVGMFDFQVTEDAIIAQEVLSGDLNRKREWRA